jgi:hypothetical protein
MVFDTTASNTAGRNKGSALAIEATLGLAILWLACHYNVYEICVKHVSDEVMIMRLALLKTARLKHCLSGFKGNGIRSRKIPQLVLKLLNLARYMIQFLNNSIRNYICLIRTNTS